MEQYSKQKVLINSLPKSGTHLLAQAVTLFDYYEHFDPDNLYDPERITPLFFTYREVKNAVAKRPDISVDIEDAIYVGTLAPVYATSDHFRYWFNAMPNGSYIIGHIGYSPTLSRTLIELGIHHLFIIRDPRAVIASLLSFILDTRGMPRSHFLEADFQERTPEERLDLLLEGGFAPRAGVQITPFVDVYNTMFGWYQDPNCLVIRFEDLIGPQGGGTLERQQTTGRQVATHLGIPFEEVADRFGEVYATNARTFREGKINSWQHSLDSASIEKLDQYCEPLCRKAGYTTL